MYPNCALPFTAFASKFMAWFAKMKWQGLTWIAIQHLLDAHSQRGTRTEAMLGWGTYQTKQQIPGSSKRESSKMGSTERKERKSRDQG